MEISFEDARERPLELVIGERVAKRIYGAVGVAQEIREQVEVLVGAGRVLAEAFDEGEHVVRRPAGDERAQNEGDGAERLAGPVLGARLLPAEQRARLALLVLEAAADGAHELFGRTLLGRLALGRDRRRAFSRAALVGVGGGRLGARHRRLGGRPGRRRRRDDGGRSGGRVRRRLLIDLLLDDRDDRRRGPVGLEVDGDGRVDLGDGRRLRRVRRFAAAAVAAAAQHLLGGGPQ